MKKRGKILRYNSAGSGLLIVEGQQYPFSLGGAWRSQAPPQPGMPVEVEFGSAGEILAIRAMPEVLTAQEHGDAVTAVKEMGAVALSKLVARLGKSRLVALGILLVAWFFLTAFSLQMPYGKINFTFWECLGFLNSRSGFEAAVAGTSNQPAGLYGLLALTALAGPFLHEFWKDRRAFLGGVLPLGFMVLISLMVRSSIENSVGLTGSMGAAMKQVQEEVLAAMTLRFGAYLGGAVSLYFAAIAVRGFLAGKASERTDQNRARKAAA